MQSIGHESQKVAAGAVMLLGPNLPHKAELYEYPAHSITVYILPILFLEMGPNADGAAILKRFCAGQTIADRILQVPPSLLVELQQGMSEMLGEFTEGRFGSELRLRARLVEMLVSLLRWEASIGKRAVPQMVRADWSHIQKALHYLHEHHTEVIYVRQIAEKLRVGERQLNGLFRELLGMGCIQYLNEYRVSLAASLLQTTSASITTVAFQVGFETLSHFNTTFRKVIGMSPTEYVGRKSKREGQTLQTRAERRVDSRVSSGS
jgi:AraC-like DNA-binding protein